MLCTLDLRDGLLVCFVILIFFTDIVLSVYRTSSNRIELHKLAQLWNTHRIRPSVNNESPAGRPDYVNFIPQSNNTSDSVTQVGDDEADMAEGHCAKVPSLRGCSP